MRGVASDVAQRPNGLLANIGLVARQQLHKDWHSASLNHDLSLGGGSRSDVGQGPGSLELDKRVGRAEELDETGHDAAFDDFLDGRVAFLRQELAKFGGRLDLLVDRIREDSLAHGGEVFAQLCVKRRSAAERAANAAAREECGNRESTTTEPARHVSGDGEPPHRLQRR